MSQAITSEGAQLDAILDELQREHRVKEISGWRTGFDNLDRALDGLLPGLYLLVGASGCGKTSFARQLLDQVALHNSVPGVFFTFTESKQELRIKTLARLSGLETREIRRGSAYLLHWYGVPRLGGEQASQLPGSWEKVKRSAQEAKAWLDRVYLFECSRSTDLPDIEQCLAEVKAQEQTNQVFAVIDDCQRLARSDRPGAERLNTIAERLQAIASDVQLPIFALSSLPTAHDQPASVWAERILGADVLGVMEPAAKPSREGPIVMDLEILRNRRGEKGKIVFEFRPALAKFSEIA